MKIKRLFNANEIYEVRRYSDFSAPIALFSVARLLSPTGVPLKAERSADMTNEDVHSSNLVLVGKPDAYDGIEVVLQLNTILCFRRTEIFEMSIQGLGS